MLAVGGDIGATDRVFGVVTLRRDFTAAWLLRHRAGRRRRN